MTDQEHYRHMASHALGGFQLIEAGLKDYIADYHDKVRTQLPANMTYEYGRQDIEDASLGKLVAVFDKTSSNKPLVGKLRKLQRRRDDLAHRALVDLYGPAQEAFDFNGQSTLLTTLAEELGALLGEILQEHAKLFVRPSNSA